MKKRAWMFTQYLFEWGERYLKEIGSFVYFLFWLIKSLNLKIAQYIVNIASKTRFSVDCTIGFQLVKNEKNILLRCKTSSFFAVEELSDILQMFDDNIKGVYGNHTCLSLQTSIDENDENLTTAHHRHLRKNKIKIRMCLNLS